MSKVSNPKNKSDRVEIDSELEFKKVYIVGTGVAAALIAKKLANVVYDRLSHTLIEREQANASFKEKLVAFQYLDRTNFQINENFISEIEALKDQDKRTIKAALDLIGEDEHEGNAISTFKQKAEKFEKALFSVLYAEISILLFEAGLQNGVSLESSDNLTNYNSYLRRFDQASAKVPNSPYPVLKQALSPNVLDIDNIPLPNPLTKGYLVQNGPIPFLSDHIRVGGGTTMHWLGTTPRMLPNDFNLSKIVKKNYYPKFEDPNLTKKYSNHYAWPINYDVLKPYYELAEYELGVSGDAQHQEYPNVNDINKYYGKEYVFPMEEIPQSYMDSEIIHGLSNKSVTLNDQAIKILMNSTPQGRNSTPNENYHLKPAMLKISETDPNKDKSIEEKKLRGLDYYFSLVPSEDHYNALGSVWNPYMGERCEGNASCVPICPVQAKYNAFKTLKKAYYKINWKNELERNENIQIQAQSVVYKLSVAQLDKLSKISKIHIRRYEAQDKSKFNEEFVDTTNAIVILAANALENPKILLNSKYVKEGHEYIVANSSDQVGRNLMDHQVMLTWGLASKPIYPYRGPGSTTNISSFRDGDFRKEHSAWIAPLDNWGWAWPTFAPGTNLSDLLNAGKYGIALKNTLTDQITRQVLFHAEIEQLPHPDNRITISDSYLDVLGIPRPIINYSISDYEKKALEQAKNASDQMFAMLNIEDYTTYTPTDPSATYYNGKLYNFKGAGHIVGTHRIGDSSKNSVTDSYCKAWDHENLYVVGAGSMPTLGTSNPTLTLAAITLRSVESILKDIKIK